MAAASLPLVPFQRDPAADPAALWPRYDAICRQLTAAAGADRLNLLGEAGGLARGMQAYPQAAKHYARAIALAEALGDAPRQAANTVRLGVVLHHGASHASAAALAGALSRLLPLTGLGASTGSDPGSDPSNAPVSFCLELAIAAFANVLSGPVTAYHDFALQHLGKLRAEQGRLAEAQDLFEGALALRLAKGEPELIASTQRALAGLAKLKQA